jgi:hypothetical protein
MKYVHCGTFRDREVLACHRKVSLDAVATQPHSLSKILETEERWTRIWVILFRSIRAVLAVEPNNPNAAPIWLICEISKARLAWLERFLSVCQTYQTCQTWAGGAMSSRRGVVSTGYGRGIRSMDSVATYLPLCALCRPCCDPWWHPYALTAPLLPLRRLFCLRLSSCVYFCCLR